MNRPCDQEQDLAGLICPLPILRIKAAMARMSPGEVLKVTVSNPESVNEIHHFVRQSGHRILAEESTSRQHLFWLEKCD